MANGHSAVDEGRFQDVDLDSRSRSRRMNAEKSAAAHGCYQFDRCGDDGDATDAADDHDDEDDDYHHDDADG